MRILLITQNFYPELGSAANRLGVIMKLLRKKHTDVQTLTTQPSYPNIDLFSNRIYYSDSQLNALESNDIHRMRTITKKQNSSLFMRLIHYFEEAIRVRIFLKKNKSNFDYIYVTTPNIIIAWATLFFKNKNYKYILEIRDLWPDSVEQIDKINLKLIMPILKYLERKMYNSSDKIVINNIFFKEHINKKLKKNIPICYLPNGVLRSEIPKTVKSDNFTVIYTGNIGFAQDVEQLIYIAKKLNENNINFTAIVYGIHTDKFNNAVKDLPFVTVKKPLPRKECLIEISKAHVALSILKPNEVFLNVLPGKIVDAISMGTIPITNLEGFTGEIINTNDIGFADENLTVEGILNHINYLKSNQRKQLEMMENAVVYRNNNFIWDDNINKLESFILGSDENEL